MSRVVVEAMVIIAVVVAVISAAAVAVVVFVVVVFIVVVVVVIVVVLKDVLIWISFQIASFFQYEKTGVVVTIAICRLLSRSQFP